MTLGTYRAGSVGCLPRCVNGRGQSQFLTDAGGTIDSVSISNINRGKARADLASYAGNLVTYIIQHNPAWALSDVIGGKSIKYLTGSPLRQTSEPNLSPNQPLTGGVQNWGAAVPNSYRACFTISMPGVTQQTCATATAQTIALYADQTYGHRITVFSVPSYKRETVPGGLAWLTGLLAKKPVRLVTVARANKMARIAWAVLCRGEVYRDAAATQAV